jgi:hypothetical protein
MGFFYSVNIYKTKTKNKTKCHLAFFPLHLLARLSRLSPRLVKCLFYVKNAADTVSSIVKYLAYHPMYSNTFDDAYIANENAIINFIMDERGVNEMITERQIKIKYLNATGVPDLIDGSMSAGICYQFTRANNSEHLYTMTREKIYKSLRFINVYSYDCSEFIIFIWIPNENIITREIIEFINEVYSKIDIIRVRFLVPDAELNEKCEVFPVSFGWRAADKNAKADYDVDGEIAAYNNPSEAATSEDDDDYYRIPDMF